MGEPIGGDAERGFGSGVLDGDGGEEEEEEEDGGEEEEERNGGPSKSMPVKRLAVATENASVLQCTTQRKIRTLLGILMWWVLLLRCSMAMARLDVDKGLIVYVWEQCDR